MGWFSNEENTMVNIYEEACKIMPPEYIDHWQTDLYLKVTKESERLVKRYKFRSLVRTFKSQKEPFGLWYDIPFAYTPGWIHDPKTGWFPD